jgi:hypothetical protein
VTKKGKRAEGKIHKHAEEPIGDILIHNAYSIRQLKTLFSILHHLLLAFSKAKAYRTILRGRTGIVKVGCALLLSQIPWFAGLFFRKRKEDDSDAMSRHSTRRYACIRYNEGGAP